MGHCPERKVLMDPLNLTAAVLLFIALAAFVAVISVIYG